MKLELKHIAPYLPYGLKMKYNNNFVSPKIRDLDLTNCAFLMNEASLVLRPLSDLTKEIEHNGEKFVPIEVIAKIMEIQGDLFIIEDDVKAFGWDENYFDDSQGYAIVWNENELNFYVCYSDDVNCEIGIYSDKYLYPLSFHYNDFQKLFEWHFDVFGLIEQGLAVNFNDVKQ